jgi:UDP-N-acetylmuramate: L-alanyl-gamma-D-glutamyl-meso-diaminopimelate ligase
MRFDLKPGSHIHMMGICGTAMASLAGLLKDRGYKVTGSDQNVYPPMSTQLEKIGIPIQLGYKKENLAPRPDLVIVGNVITRNHEEAQALLASDIPYASLPQAMGELVIADRHSIVISGTHGKTTTTSLMAWIAQSCGLNPGFMVGGIPKNFSLSYQLPKGDWFVIEGDEYDTAFFDKVPKFIHYRPRSVILTSIEFDHADIYRDLNHVKEAFVMLMKLIPEDGNLIVSAEDENIQSILASCKAKNIKSFGLKKGDYHADGIQANAQGTEFDVLHQGKKRAHLKTQMIGDYNIKNALAAYALCEQLNWPEQKVIEAIASFTGVKRRQDIIGQPNGITIIEDFAHHPTAVKGTIETVQARYPKAKVFSVFELRSATSRRKVFQKEYVEAFSKAQAVLLPQPYNQTSIPESDRFSIDELIHDLRAKGVAAELCSSVDEIVAHLKAQAKPGDVILIMSNGGFEGIYQKLLAQL